MGHSQDPDFRTILRYDMNLKDPLKESQTKDSFRLPVAMRRVTHNLKELLYEVHPRRWQVFNVSATLSITN